MFSSKFYFTYAILFLIFFNNGHSQSDFNFIDDFEGKTITNIKTTDDGVTFIATDKGLYKSGSVSNDWVLVGLADSYIFELFVHENSLLIGHSGLGIYICSLDGSNLRQIGGYELRRVQSFATNSLGYLYAGTNSRGVFMSLDNGFTWEQKSIGLPQNETILKIVSDENNVLYLGCTDGIYKSSNYGNEWEGMDLSELVLDMAILQNGDIIAAANSAGYYRLANGTDNWIRLNSAPSSTSLAVISSKNDDLYVGTMSQGIFKSTNNGDNWTRFDNNLSGLTIESFGVNQHAHLYAGTSNGLYLSSDPIYSSFALQELSSTIEGLRYSNTQWGDYNKDGNLDFVLMGSDLNQIGQTLIYKNTGEGNFSKENYNLMGLKYGDVKWGDLDNDGDLDLIMTGEYENFNFIIKIYENVDNGFTDTQFDYVSGKYRYIELGDYDGDGLLDILASGMTNSHVASVRLLKNHGDFNFVDTSTEYVPSQSGPIEWGDFDNDGDLDFFCGASGIYLFENDGAGNFTNKLISNELTSYIDRGDIILTDFNVDGYQDIVQMGYNDEGIYKIKIYKNIDGSFIDSEIELPGLKFGKLASGDLDNDGQPDIVAIGRDDNDESKTIIYKNKGNNYEISVNELMDVTQGSATFGDLNNDGNLDLLLTGFLNGWPIVGTKIYKNITNITNYKPSIPGNTSYSFQNESIILSWDIATDNETKSIGLTYDISLFNKNNERYILPMVIDKDGILLSPRNGNNNFSTQVNLKNLEEGNYLFNVSAIDNAFNYSEKSLIVEFKVLEIPGLLTPFDMQEDLESEILFTWNAVENAISYELQISTDMFNNAITSYTLNDTQFSWLAQTSNTMYYWRVRAIASDGYSYWSDIFSFSTINLAPLITNIQDQTIAEGEQFTNIVLDDYVEDVDNQDSEIVWTYGGNMNLSVSINNDRIASIIIPDSNWFGSETIIFTATDPGGLSASDDVIFTVTPVNDAPRLTDLPTEITFPSDSSYRMSLKNKIVDVDNELDELTIETSVTSDSIFVDYDMNTMELTISSITDYGGQAELIIRVADQEGAFDEKSILVRVDNVTSIQETNDPQPNEYLLSQNYPNPFNPSTHISYSIKEQGMVRIEIYDLQGRMVKELVNEFKIAGQYSIIFNANNLASGIYYYTLRTDNFVSTKKMLLIK